MKLSWNLKFQLIEIKLETCMELSFLDIIYTCNHHPSKFWHISSVTQLCPPLCGHTAPHGPQHTRPPCLSPTPRVYPNSCPLSWWCHPTISSFVVPFSCLQSFKWVASGGQSIGVSALASFLPGLISFRMDWLDLLAVQGTLKSLLQHHSSIEYHSAIKRNTFDSILTRQMSLEPIIQSA